MTEALYPDIGDWFKDCRRVIERDYDNLFLFTGDEGIGKSKTMRLILRKLDPTFTVDRIHFEQADFLDQAVTLQPGQAIALDEFSGHRRASMHGHRLELLEFLKECRGLNLNMGLAYPHVNQLDRDVLNTRVRWWCHHPMRGFVDVHRRVSRVGPQSGGDPEVVTRWPFCARFPIPADVPDPLGPAYRAKKEARMRDRAARRLGGGDGGAGASMFDKDAALAVLREAQPTAHPQAAAEATA